MLLRHAAPEQNKQLSNLAQLIEKNFSNPTYKKRFAVSTHQGTYFLDVEQIAFFMADESVIFAIDALGKKHLLTATTLKDIEAQLNPSDFFRINRSELIHKPYVEKIERYSKNSLAINIKGSHTLLKTSQSQTSSFREWIEK
jgi:DNA-binding LytR/AlgR family response regulator